MIGTGGTGAEVWLGGDGTEVDPSVLEDAVATGALEGTREVEARGWFACDATRVATAGVTGDALG